MSSDLDGEDHEILDSLKEMLEGAKESESVFFMNLRKSQRLKKILHMD